MTTKTCYRCKETKDIDEFIRDRSRKSGYKNMCRKCRGEAEINLCLVNPKSPSSDSKTCPQCRIEKTVSEFSKSRRTSDGLSIICKECMKQYLKKYRAQNRLRSPSVDPKVCSQCKETKNAIEFAPNTNHPDGLNYLCRECTREKDRQNHAANPKRKIRTNRKWRQAHLDTWNATGHKRRARKKSIPGFYSSEDVHRILQQQKNLCVYCQTSLIENYTIDHIIPLSRPGSSNWPENIQLLCRSCNSSKGAKSHDEYLAWLNTV